MSIQTATAPPDFSLDAPRRRTTSWWVKLRPVYPFLVIAGFWQIAAMQAGGNYGLLFPTLDRIAIRFWELVTGPLMRALAANPNLPFLDYFYYLGQSPILWHTLATAWRLPLAFALGALVGVPIGILMGRYAFWESFFVPVL